MNGRTIKRNVYWKKEMKIRTERLEIKLIK